MSQAVPSVPADTVGPADLVDCADEPIRTPGSIQPHGALLALDGAGHRVVVASANVVDHLGAAAQDLLGRPAAEVLGRQALAGLAAGEESAEPRRVEITRADGGRRAFDLLVHRSEGALVVELEPRDDAEVPPRTRQVLRTLQGARTRAELTLALAREMRRVTGFDRVMVYRFDEEWNGEVVAEDARGDLEPFLGLHYPAGDIPAQARALYTSQWLRSIPDATYTPSPLISVVRSREPGEALDLSGCALRSVSPVHLQYLANMGVRASMSVSLLVHGRLWGLVACHHYAGPHYPSAATRSVAEFLGRTGSLLLQGKEDESRYVDTLAIAATAADLTRSLAADIRAPLDVLTREAGGVLDLVDGAAGAAVRVHGELRLLGQTPTADDVADLADLLWSGGRRPVVSGALSRDVPGHLPQRITGTASGVLAVPLTSGSHSDYLMWFRPEVLREVTWAGNPHASGLEATDAGLRLTPRASFAAWVEQVRGASEPWSATEVAAAQRLGQDVDELLARRTAEDGRIAAALQRIVLTEQPTIPAGFALASRYQPSGGDILGGDWYDVTVLPDGRVVVMVGDVAGHGMGVAAITAQMRHALRAYLVNEGSAGAALRRLGTLVGELLPGKLATVAAAELEPSTGVVRVSSAGHLPILHLAPDGGRLVQEASGPALGVDVASPYVEATVALAPGDALVLYTDGLVEQRGVHLLTSLEDLRDRAQAASREPDELCERLLAGAPATRDDVTVLAIRRY